MEYASLFETGFGRGVVIASARGVCAVVLPDSDGVSPAEQAALSGAATSPLTERVAGMLESYFKGECQDFADIPVDLRRLSPFRARILSLVREIPCGEVRSYGEVAAIAGVPRAARAVGGAMASNPVPIIIPCHRVIAANGNLTGFTAPGGMAVKKILLQMEGVEFKGGQVRRKTDCYKQDKVGIKSN